MTFNVSQSPESEPKKDRGGDWQRVYWKRQFDQTALLLSTIISCAAQRTRRFVLRRRQFSVNQRH